MDIQLDLKGIDPFISSKHTQEKSQLETAYQQLIKRSGKGNDFLGWLDLPNTNESNLIQEINICAKRLQKQSNIVVVIGIGGSYLGSRAVIEALQNPFKLFSKDNDYPQFIFAGNSLSEQYHAQLLDLLDHNEYSIIVISKSGTTTEPAIAFRLLKDHCEKKYGNQNSSERIVVITDQKRGALKQVANENHYQSFVIPDDVGGRYSVLSPVGLLPIAVAGVNISELLHGALEMRSNLMNHSTLSDNIALQYAWNRYLLYQSGKKIELLVSFEPALSYFIEWFKQLFGESEGKENKGIFPAGAVFSTDLHSLGQYIQEGERHLFETFISIEKSGQSLKIPYDSNDLDGLNYIQNKTIHEVNQIAETGTMMAHFDGQVPCFKLIIPELNPTVLGELIFFFEFSCALGGYLLDVNPFDQPGVEAYKNNMFRLLGKK